MTVVLPASMCATIPMLRTALDLGHGADDYSARVANRWRCQSARMPLRTACRAASSPIHVSSWRKVIGSVQVIISNRL